MRSNLRRIAAAARPLLSLALAAVGFATATPTFAASDLEDALPADFVFQDATHPPKPPAKPAAAAKAEIVKRLYINDGRQIIEASPLLILKRISDAPSPVPVTHSTTDFGQWKVACESRASDEACFAAAYAPFNGATLKVKFGPAAPAATLDLSDASKPTAKPDPHIHYVIELEGPPNLDVDTGFVLIAPRAVGIFPLSASCNAQSCRITAEVDSTLSSFLIPDNPNGGGFAVLASAQTTTYLWRFSTSGLSDAFQKIRDEAEKDIPKTRPPTANIALVTPVAPGRPIDLHASRRAAETPSHYPHKRKHLAAHHEHHLAQTARFVPSSL